MKPITHALREKILAHKKSRLDISELIKGVNIKGENLAGTIITHIDLSDRSAEQTNFSDCIIGLEHECTVNFNRANLRNCLFVRTRFPGPVWARRADLRDCNLKGAYVPYIDYKFADMRGCNFCDCVFTIGTAKSYGAMFDNKFFKDLAQWWGIEITITGMEGKNGQERNSRITF